MNETHAPAKPTLRRPLRGRFDHRSLDVEAGGMRRAMTLDQMQDNTAGAAAYVEDYLVPERKTLEDPVDFIRPARRQIPLAPQRFEEADGGVVILRRGISRFDHQTLVPSVECPVSSAGKA